MDSTYKPLAAIFPDGASAHAAIDALEQQGFARPWMAVTRLAEGNDWGDAAATAAPSQHEVAESSDGVFGAIGRFFSGEGNSLRRSLEDHGLTTAEAESIDTAMSPHNAVVVLGGDERLELASQIVGQYGGRVTESGAHSHLAAESYQTTSPSATAAAAYDEPIGAAGSVASDETRRLELREERLRIDKDTVSAGQVTVGKRVETERTSVDVPVYHEEIFIERRPVTSSTVSSTAPIGSDGETITIPLSREEVRVDKTAVVREEVVVGKRRVEETQHIDETLRREELDESSLVGAAGTTAGLGGTTGFGTGTTAATSAYDTAPARALDDPLR